MEPGREEKLEQLEKILQSQTLQGSESLKAFLRFVVLKSVDNQDGHLKEYTIATEVFGRDDNYDPRVDSVVRVQAVRLRSKLQEYYDKEGKDDKVLIDLPKGHYTPAFSYIQDRNGSPATETTAPGSETTSPSPEPVSFSDRRLKLLVIVLASLFLTSSIFALSYRSEAKRLKESLASRAVDSAEMQALAPLWGDFLRSPEPVLVAYSNTIFEGRPETGMKYWKPLDSPGRSPVSPLMPQSVGATDQNASLIIDHYTGVGEVMGVYFLGNMFWKAGHSFRIKRSLLLNWDDLKTENIVFLGSPAENLLLRELPQKQEFVFGILGGNKHKADLGIINLKPRAGEQETYLLKREGPAPEQILEDYAVVSLLKGLDSKHRLLILAGITTLGTQAAAEYVTKPEYVSELISHLNTAPAFASPMLPPYFQVLLRVKVNGGVPVQISHITHRVLE